MKVSGSNWSPPPSRAVFTMQRKQPPELYPFANRGLTGLWADRFAARPYFARLLSALNPLTDISPQLTLLPLRTARDMAGFRKSGHIYTPITHLHIYTFTHQLYQ